MNFNIFFLLASSIYLINSEIPLFEAYPIMKETLLHVSFNNLSIQYYSQFGQDKYLVEQLFKFKKNGFFFDIGAHDGISFSNTYFFEKELGWSGICIEPKEDVFKSLTKNRKSTCVNGCIYKFTGEREFLNINGPIEMWSGIIESYDPQHMLKVDKLIKEHGGSKEIIKINTYTFNDICKKHNIKQIDFLSIDTEGSEEDILKSIDFENISIEVIAVENNYNKDTIKKFLETKKYKFVCKIGMDEIYKKK